MLGRVVNETLRERKAESVWGDTISLLRNADFRACNLECAISDDGEPWILTPKEFHFRSDSKNVKVLSAAKINAVSLANNHALDFGYAALHDMVKTLDGAEIKHAGAGDSIEDARRPAIVSCKGSKIGMIAFTDNEPEWEAVEKRPGVFYATTQMKEKRVEKILEIVTDIRAKVDTLIVSAHWGPNWGYEPPKEHIVLAHALVDSGADIVFGHSGHVFRGVEIYRGRPILYCTGDFVDDYAIDSVERNDESFIFVLEKLDGSFSHVRMYPTKIEDCRARMARGSEKYYIAEKMQILSTKLKSSCTWYEDKGYLDIAV